MKNHLFTALCLINLIGSLDLATKANPHPILVVPFMFGYFGLAYMVQVYYSQYKNKAK